MIDPENWSRANFFEQLATEYLKATKSRRLGWPDGVWAPFEERGDARQRGRSAGRLESIDCYRWPRIRSSVLCYPILLHGAPPHSHSIIFVRDNALKSRRKRFLHTTKNRLCDPSEICALDSKDEFPPFEVCSVSATIDINRSPSPIKPRQKFSKKTVTRLSATRVGRETEDVLGSRPGPNRRLGSNRPEADLTSRRNPSGESRI